MKVFIQSVPWRLANLNAELADLASQTFQDFELHLVLDGYSGEQAARVEVPGMFDVCITRNEVSLGAWYRWKLIEDRAGHEEIFFVLDDDYRINSTYIARNLALMELYPSVAWFGLPAYSPNGFFPVSNVEKATDVVHFGAGSFVSRGKCLKGFSKCPLYTDFSHPQSADDLYVSWWYWLHGSRIVRPIGVSGLTDAVVGSDDRSKFKAHGARQGADFSMLVHKYGFPGNVNVGRPGVRNINVPTPKKA